MKSLFCLMSIVILTCSFYTECNFDVDETQVLPGWYNHTQPLDFKLSEDPTLDPKYKVLMQKRLQQYIQLTIQNAPPSFENEQIEWEGHESWVFYGTGGRALIFFKLYQNTNQQEYLQQAKDYIDAAISRTKFDPKNFGFQKGQEGIYALASVIYHLLGEEEKSNIFADKIKSTFENNINEKVDSVFDVGINGLVYAAQFVNYFTKQDKIPIQYIERAGDLIMQIGIQNSLENGTLQWPVDYIGEKWIFNGQGMGSNGQIYRLLTIPSIINNENYRYYIKQTILTFLKAQKPNGQVLGLDEEHYPNRVQWCHGAPGFIPVFIRAGRIFKEIQDKCVRAALNAANFTYYHGILLKGMQLGHGTSGNSLLLLDLYKQLKAARIVNPTIANRILKMYYKMHQIALDIPSITDPENGMTSNDCVPYSGWISSIGSSIIAWSDMLTNLKEPEKSYMIGFQLPTD